MSSSDRGATIRAADVLGQLGDSLRQAHDGDAWHGPALAELLRDVDVSTAAARPVAGGHSIWEIVLHLTGWTREVARRLAEGDPQLPEGGDWPDVHDPSPAAWNLARVDLALAHVELARALAAFSPARFTESLGTARDAPLGTGVTYLAMILGALQHAGYHGGQIALLKKAIGTPRA
jgi:hypothetical protein